MTTSDPTRDDTHQRERDRAVEALTRALETDDVEKKTTRFGRHSNSSR
jgi:hypothetical protein